MSLQDKVCNRPPAVGSGIGARRRHNDGAAGCQGGASR